MKKHLIGILLCLPLTLWGQSQAPAPTTAPDAVVEQTEAAHPVAPPVTAISPEQKVADALTVLAGKKLKAKTDALETLFVTETTPDRRNAIFTALADKRLMQTSDKQVVIVGDNDSVTDAQSGATVAVAVADLKKIRTNNKIRKMAKSYLSQLDISSSDRDKRLSAVTVLLGKISKNDLSLIQNRLAKEGDEDIKALLTDAEAIWQVKYSGDNAAKITALRTLSGSLQPMAKNTVAEVLTDQSADREVTQVAGVAMDRIERNLRTYRGIETAFFGLSMGSVLLLAAVGLAITFGVMGVINMAHGEMIMIGAYCTYVLQQVMPNNIGLSLILAVPVAFVVTAIVGVIIEKTIIRFLYGRPLETLLATFGLSLVLQQAIRSIFSPLNRTVESPSWLMGSIQVNPVLSFTINRLVIIVFAFAVFACIVWLMKKTAWGLQIRAVSQNRAMARGIGIRSERVNALTFGIGSGIAGIAGVALSQLTNVGPNMGQAYIIDSFMVVVFGGVGNLMGTLVGAITLGELNKILEPFSGAVLAKVAILVFIIIFIQNKPRGLFPQKGRDVEG